MQMEPSERSSKAHCQEGMECGGIIGVKTDVVDDLDENLLAKMEDEIKRRMAMRSNGKGRLNCKIPTYLPTHISYRAAHCVFCILT
jgi:hypothetical protein